MSLKHLNVAHVAFRGKLDVTTKAPQEIRLGSGEALHLQATYDYAENSTDKEDLHIELRTWLDGKANGVASFDQVDRYRVYDEASGKLEKAIAGLPPGEHVLRFQVAAVVSREPWTGTRRAEEEVQEAGGEIHVTVA